MPVIMKIDITTGDKITYRENETGDMDDEEEDDFRGRL